MNFCEFENKMAQHGQIMRERMASPNVELREENVNMKIGYKKIGTIVIAAAIITALGLSALGATFNWHEKLLEFFSATPEQMENLSDATSFPGVSASDNGWTFTVLQTITDSHGLYVLFEAEFPEGTEINDEMRFERYGLNVDYEIDESEQVMLNTTSCEMLSLYENKAVFMTMVSGSQKLNSGDISLKLQNFGYWDHDEEYAYYDFVPVWGGSVNLDWVFDYEISSKTYYPNTLIEFGDRKVTLASVEVSPLSVWLTFEGDDVLTGIEPVYKFRDGTEITQTPLNDVENYYGFSSFSSQGGGICTVSRRFNKVHDIEDLVSVTVNGVTVELK